MLRGEQLAVGRFCGLPGFISQCPHEHAVKRFLVNDHRLPPTVGIAQLVLKGGAVIPAAIVQVEHQPHAGGAYEFLNAAHGAKFWVVVVKFGKLAVHVAVQPA